MDKFKLVADIKSMLEKVQPLADIVEALESMGSIDQAAADALAAKVEAYAALEGAKSELDVKLSEVAQVESQMQDLILSREKMLSDARELGAKLQAEADAELQAKHVRFQEYKDACAFEMEKAASDLADVKKDVEDYKVELVELESKVAEMKAKLAEFIKG